ncbi:putative membrane protein [Rhodococcus sp. MTM3W5.2]|nr:putative membrane protein [Rhodococcus sp. MTM3W5.2]
MRYDPSMDAPWWRVVTAMVLSQAAFIYSLMVTPGAAIAWTVGILEVIVGMGCVGMSIARTLHENAGHRIPMLGSPPVRPRRFDLFAGVGFSLVVGGAVLIVGVRDRGSWPMVALLAVMAITATVPYVIHNSRL